MSQEKIKVPVKGGLEKARQRLKEMRKKSPSPELVKTIEEVTHQEPKKKRETDIAAKPKSDLDL